MIDCYKDKKKVYNHKAVFILSCFLSIFLISSFVSAGWFGDFVSLFKNSEDSNKAFSPFCTDSDGGFYPHIAGTTSGVNGDYVDTCIDENHLSESYCSASGWAYKVDWLCVKGSSCLDGACKKVIVNTTNPYLETKIADIRSYSYPAMSSEDYPAIYENKIVYSDYKNGDSDIYLYDSISRIRTNVTNGKHGFGPDIYNNNIVYRSYRNGNSDIYMYNILTSTETRITTDSSLQTSPAIYGDLIVYEDNRNGNSDIYMYNILTSTETRITTNLKMQGQPKIFDSKIVYVDNRNNIYDVYMYDLLTGNEIRIAQNRVHYFPIINRNKVVYYGYKTDYSIPGNSNSDIYMYDISKNTEIPITKDLKNQYYPVIYGDIILYSTDNGAGDFSIYMVVLNSSCTENWACGSWSSCANGNQIRTCLDTSNCGTSVNKPSTLQNCNATILCTDSDGGINYNLQGNTSGIEWAGSTFVSKIDYCEISGPKAGLLIEHKCQDNQVGSESYNCSYGCSNGVCNMPTCIDFGYNTQDGILSCCDVNCSSYNLNVCSNKTYRCIDYDNGLNYYTASNVSSSVSFIVGPCCSGTNGCSGNSAGSGGANDVCINSQILRERVCNVNNTAGYVDYNCSFEGKTCTNGQCVTTICTPSTCSTLGKTCGSWSNGCGGTISCGTCVTGKTCTNGQCVTSGCVDPDGRTGYYTKTNVTGVNGIRIDSCIGSYLYEAYCSGRYSSSIRLTCPSRYRCFDGACILR